MAGTAGVGATTYAQVVSIENIVTGTGNDTVIADGAANRIETGDGDDLLEGGGGGADTLDGGTGINTLAYTSSGSGVAVWLLTGMALGSDASGDVFSNMRNLVGSAFGDMLSGDDILDGSNGNDVLNGDLGADTMQGGAGDDTYHMDESGDVVIEAADQRTDRVVASVSFSVAGQFIENLTLTGAAAINGTGNSLANRIIGNGAANVIDGGTGADTLEGGSGADSFLFATNLVASNIDHITDFLVADDTILLLGAIFAALPVGAVAASAFVIGAAAADALDRIIYDSATDVLLYDADGTGASEAVQFATLTPGLALTAADFLVV